VQYRHRYFKVQALPRVSLPVPGIIRALVPRSVILLCSTRRFILLLLPLQQSIVQDAAVPTAPHSDKKKTFLFPRTQTNIKRLLYSIRQTFRYNQNHNHPYKHIPYSCLTKIVREKKYKNRGIYKRPKTPANTNKEGR